MALFALTSTLPISVSVLSHRRLPSPRRLRFRTFAAISSSSYPESSASPSVSSENVSTSKSAPKSFIESNGAHDPNLNYTVSSPNGSPPSPFVQFIKSTEYNIEKTIFDFRFFSLLAIGGSLAGSVICFLNGCVFIVDAYKVYWSSCVKGVHSGKMVLRLVEAIDTYLAGTVMLIFGMGLYGLFISNVTPDSPPSTDRALKGSSLFGMFALKERPKWMKISSLDELKTKVGHVIVMILLVKMFERSKMVQITTGMDLLSYSICIFLSSASLYILHHLHKE